MSHPLSEAYQKARRQYALFSGLLIAWELIGFELPNKVELVKGGNLIIKSPQAAPWVLIVLVLYFAGRTTLEWYQCSEDSRGLRASLIDFRSAHLIGLFALGLYSVQKLLQIQVATKVSEHETTANWVIMGAMIGVGLGHLWLKRRTLARAGILDVAVALTPFVAALSVWWLILGHQRPHFPWLLLGAGVGISVLWVQRVLFKISTGANIGSTWLSGRRDKRVDDA